MEKKEERKKEKRKTGKDSKGMEKHRAMKQRDIEPTVVKLTRRKQIRRPTRPFFLLLGSAQGRAAGRASEAFRIRLITVEAERHMMISITYL
jgi:hypothetical protein